MTLPIYELLVSEDDDSKLEVNYVAGVDVPAIEKTWLAFKDQPDLLSFAAADETEHIIVGAAMIPDLKIYRKDEETGEEFYVIFSRQTIATIAEKFYTKNYQQNFNLMHDPSQQKDGVVFFMSFLKDEAKGMVGLKGDYPDGTWFLGAKVNNEEVWAKVQSGEIKGFSVEGLFGFKKKQMSLEERYAKIKELLNGIDEDL